MTTVRPARWNSDLVKCRHCGHAWLPRVSDPRRCPRCNLSDWKRKAIAKEPRRFNLLEKRETALVGKFGEYLAKEHLHSNGVQVYDWGAGQSALQLPAAVEQKLSDAQRDYLAGLRESEETWSWDYVGLRGISEAYLDAYLIEVKTNRPGTTKRGLKGNWSRRRRRAITAGDLWSANLHGFTPMLINVSLLPDWTLEISVTDLVEKLNEKLKKGDLRAIPTVDVPPNDLYQVRQPRVRGDLLALDAAIQRAIDDLAEVPELERLALLSLIRRRYDTGEGTPGNIQKIGAVLKYFGA